MAKPTSDAEVNDVLSSVRRLVAEQRDQQKAAGDVSPAGDRLLLSAKQRVETPDVLRLEPDTAVEAETVPAQQPEESAPAPLPSEPDAPSAATEDTMAIKTSASDEEEDVIDEAALRDLVAEIVREELRGHLGDRITLNVRKLVRQEIRRMMATRDME
ncbi:hypothetical protein [uncultured Roseobacter sp.]|uniref:hypothetical protein n=1 Tax=uncultured Roseobacter sp. TaxID=114847 RepID=UPI00260C30F8|nr:hypothetical protein [uncultured Roseobacter sp.]